MKRARFQLLLAVATAACINTQMTRLAGFDPQRPSTCWQAVHIYATADAIGAPHVELAYLRTETTDPTSDESLLKNMKQKAAEIGANGIIFGGVHEQVGRVGLVTGAFQAKPSAQGVGVWIPRDSAATMKLCGDSLALDSIARAGP